MKINILKRVSKGKIGRINRNGVKLEPNETSTFEYLTLFGFNIEVIRPCNIKNNKNPDVLIMGSIWEVKTPTGYNRNTIRNRFREASAQASKIVFDLRYIKKYSDKVERQVVNMFRKDGEVRRMIIVRKDGQAIDFMK